MANTSIYAAFERMWQHVTAALGTKASLGSANTYNGEQKFQNSQYCPTAQDNASGVGAAYKASRGAVNQEIVGQIIMPYTACSDSYGCANEVNTIKFQKITGTSDGQPTLSTVATLTDSKFQAPKVYGAVWNDYAEYRKGDDIAPGYCVRPQDSGSVTVTNERLCPCDGIVSDTFGFAIGETNEAKLPLAVSGRVLAYYEGDKEDYHAGDVVCASVDGKVSKMTREEIREWPDRIVGVVSEIPDYETWGTGNALVNGRIWIKVK